MPDEFLDFKGKHKNTPKRLFQITVEGKNLENKPMIRLFSNLVKQQPEIVISIPTIEGDVVKFKISDEDNPNIEEIEIEKMLSNFITMYKTELNANTLQISPV